MIIHTLIERLCCFNVSLEPNCLLRYYVIPAASSEPTHQKYKTLIHSVAVKTPLGVTVDPKQQTRSAQKTVSHLEDRDT